MALWLGAGATIAAGQTPGAAVPAENASISGTVTDAITNAPIAGASITAVESNGASKATTSAADGSYTLTVSAGTYTLTFTASGYKSVSTSTGFLPADTEETVPEILEPLPGALTGTIRDSSGHPLYGMQLTLQGGLYGYPEYAASGPSGGYTFSGIDPGSYSFTVADGNNTVPEGTVTIARGATVTVNVTLGAAPVPAGTAGAFAARGLAELNAERARLGLPAGIVLNQRWSLECAAHDIYMHDNDLLEHPEDPTKPGASAGGAWAGTSSVLSEGGAWTRSANPWEDAPIHLDQLFAPSLSVIGIDDSHGYQCATTFPGMLRTPTATDVIYTYPGDRSRGFPTSENANESPFVPGQFVGVPAGRTAGRELFVYLNLAGHTGQAQVKIRHASLFGGRRRATVRWVDNSTGQIGPYLAGGILIPVKPLAPATSYQASVTVQDGTRALTHRWTFRTAGKPPRKRHRHR
jgi:hypothetical protein